MMRCIRGSFEFVSHRKLAKTRVQDMLFVAVLLAKAKISARRSVEFVDVTQADQISSPT